MDKKLYAGKYEATKATDDLHAISDRPILDVSDLNLGRCFGITTLIGDKALKDDIFLWYIIIVCHRNSVQLVLVFLCFKETINKSLFFCKEGFNYFKILKYSFV